jgi:tetratricopeptide (TPR) repeat protein
LELEEARIAESIGQSQSEAARAAVNRALALYARADDRLGFAEAQLFRGLGLIHGGSIAEGERVVHAVLAVAQSGGTGRLTALATHALAVSRYFGNDLGAARSLYRETLTLYKTGGCDQSAAIITYSLAEIEFQAGDIETALRLGREAAEVLGANRGWASLAAVLPNCSAYLVALSRFEEGRKSAREAVVLAREAGVNRAVTLALQHLAAIAALRARDSAEQLVDLQHAACVLGFANARFADPGWARQYTEQQEYDNILPILRSKLGAAFDEHLEEGKRWSQDQAVAVAFTI